LPPMLTQLPVPQSADWLWLSQHTSARAKWCSIGPERHLL